MSLSLEARPQDNDLSAFNAELFDLPAHHNIAPLALDMLNDKDFYPVGSPLYRYIHERISVLCGDDMEIPEIYVIDDDVVNASTDGHAVYVNRGLIDLFEFEEEIDGVLAHELIHMQKDHVSRRQAVLSKEGTLSTLGMTRISELEADIEGFKLLDDRGINPRGLMSAFEKMEAHQKEIGMKVPLWAQHSPTHGSEEDRKVNLAQSLWVRDMRSLDSNALHPKHLQPADYGPPYNAAQDNHFYELRPLEQLEVIRHIQKKPHCFAPEEIKIRQTAVLKNLSPDVPDTICEQVATLLIEAKNQSEDQAPQERLQTYVNLLEQSSLFSNEAVRCLISESATEVINSSLPDALPEILEAGSLVPVARLVSEHGSNKEAFVAVITQYVRKHKLSAEHLSMIGTVIAEDDVALEVFLQRISGVTGRFGGVNVPEDQLDDLAAKISYLDKQISRQRMETAQSLINKPAELLAYLNRYSTRGRSQSQVDRDLTEDQENEEFEGLQSDKEQVTFEYMEFELWDKMSPAARGILAQIEVSRFADTFGASGLEPPTTFRMEFSDDEEEEDEFLEDYELQDEYDEKMRDSRTSEFGFQTIAGSFRREIADLFSGYRPKTIKHMLEKAGIDESEQRSLFLLVAELRDADANLDKFGLALLGGDKRHAARYLSEYLSHMREREVTRIQKLSYEEKIEANALFKEHNWLLPALKKVNGYIERFTQDGMTVIELNDLLNGLPHIRYQLMESILIKCHRADTIPGSRLNTENILAQYVMNFSPGRIQQLLQERGNHFNRSGDFYSRLEVNAGEILRSLYDQEQSLDSLPPQRLQALLAIGLMSHDVEINLSLPAACVKALITNLSFDEGYQLVFEDLKHLPPYALGSAIEYLIEEKAETAEQLGQLSQHMRDRIQMMIDSNYSRLGAGSIIDTQIVEGYKGMKNRSTSSGLTSNTLRGAESTKLLAAILKTSQEPDDLEAYMFDRWWTAQRVALSSREAFNVEDYVFYRSRNKENRLEWWLRHDLSHEYTPLSNVMDSIYLANNMARYVALRKLLLGTNGVLTDEAGRQELVDALKETWFNVRDNPQANLTIATMLQSLIEVNGSDELYQYLSPVLQELILRPPSRPADQNIISHNKAVDVLETLRSRGKISDFTERDVANMQQRINLLLRVANSLRQKHSYTKNLKSAIRSLLPADENETDRPSELSPVQMALLMGKRSGAIGTRMLQLGGQYYEIPEADRPEFDKIYDQVTGQTRVQAHLLLQREASYAPEVCELLDDLRHFGHRIGGGSLVTVYEIETASRGKEVLGIRNPNAAYHVAEIAEMVDRTLEDALRRDPDNIDLMLARSLVYDAVDWINRELNDHTFNAKDAAFRAENDTRNGSGNGFQKGRSRYDVWVPQTTPTGSLWIRREELVEGHNLNGLKIGQQTDIPNGIVTKEDQQHIVSTLVRNFTHQLLNGTYAHSDAHPGNFRISTDNTRIAILDRYNLIPMDTALKANIKELFKAMATGNVEQAVDVFISTAETTGTLDDQKKAELADTLKQDDVTKAATAALVHLKKYGVKIPLEMSLLMRNIFAFVGMAKDAGFNSLADAFVHTADEQEIQKLITALN